MNLLENYLLEKNNNVFGKMYFNHGWKKKQSITLFNKSYTVNISASAYTNEVITEEQEKSYSIFMNKQNKLLNKAELELKKYINKNIDNIPKINDIEEISNYVFPKTILFKKDGSIIILLDCDWDIEHGIGIKIYPKFSIGIQDIFL